MANGIRRYKVYCHTNKINGKQYIGVTSQPLHRRFRNGEGYVGCVHFYNAICKYGWEEFATETLFTNLTKKQAEEKEVYLIAKWKTLSPHGYNLSIGGKLNSKATEETLNRISIGRSKFKISQYTLDGIFIKEWETARDVAKALNVTSVNIRECCNRNHETCKGFVFRYDDDIVFNEEEIHWIKVQKEWEKYSSISKASSSTKRRKVKCINSGEIFNSLSDATKVHNTSRNMISKCCQGKSRSAGDYKGRPMMWRYIDGY